MVIEDGGQFRIVVAALLRKRWAARVFRLSSSMKSISTPCFIDGAKEVLPCAAYLDIRLIDTPGGRAITLVRSDALFQLGRITLHPAETEWMDPLRRLAPASFLPGPGN